MLSLYLLQLLHSSQVIPDIKPETIIFDMEKAAATTFTKVFGDVNVHFCYFHWRQALRKNLSNKGCLKVIFYYVLITLLSLIMI